MNPKQSKIICTHAKDRRLHRGSIVSVCNILCARLWEGVCGTAGGQNKISKFTVAASRKAHVHTFSPVKQLYNILCHTQTAATHTHTHSRCFITATRWHIYTCIPSEGHTYTLGKKLQQSSAFTQSYVVRGIQFHSCQTSLYCFIAFFPPPNTVLCASTHRLYTLKWEQGQNRSESTRDELLQQ